MAFEFKIDAGIDPDLHIAKDVDSLSESAAMLSLKSISEANGIPGSLVAKLIPQAEKGVETPADGMDVGADILRDCYGKIDHFILPSSLSAVGGDICKILKAFRSKTRVTVACAKNGESSESFPDRLPDGFPLAQADETVSVSKEDALKAVDEAAAQGITIDLPSGAALFAAVQTAKQANDRRARCVVLLTRV